MNGRLDKVAMTNKLMQLKRELHYKCEIGEKGEWECNGANEYLNRVFDVLDGILAMKKFNSAVLNVTVAILDFLYRNRPAQRFWVLEVIARAPYFAFISVLHLRESLRPPW